MATPLRPEKSAGTANTVSEQVRGILAAAEARAERLLADSTEEAERILAQATEAAELVRADADRAREEAAQLRAAAVEEATMIREFAQGEAERRIASAESAPPATEPAALTVRSLPGPPVPLSGDDLPAARPPRHQDEARRAALPLVVAGRSREETQAHLVARFGDQDYDALLSYLFGERR